MSYTEWLLATAVTHVRMRVRPVMHPQAWRQIVGEDRRMLVIVKVNDVAVHVMLAVVYIVMETELQLQLSAGRLQWQSGWDAGLCSFISLIHLFAHLLSRLRYSRPRPRLWVPGPRLISSKPKAQLHNWLVEKNHYSHNRVMCSHENDDLLIKISLIQQSFVCV